MSEEVVQDQQEVVVDAIRKFRYLTTLERGDIRERCGFLLENGMQCPLLGYIELLNDEDQRIHYLCRFHTTNSMAVASAQHITYTEVKDNK